ncbi:uncharacterized protein LOC111118750 [Crassostrea virginica]
MTEVNRTCPTLEQDSGVSAEAAPSMPTEDRHLLSSANKESIKIIRKYVPVLTRPKRACASGRLRLVYVTCGCLLFGVSLALMVAGTIRVNQCNKEEEMAWSERFIEENVDQFIATNNFALEKPTKQSSDQIEGSRGYSELAVDGDSTTCSQTDAEMTPSWWVDLRSVRPIEAVIIKGPNTGLQNISITILRTEPRFGPAKSGSSEVPCYYQTEISGSIITSCGQNAIGRYVLIRKKTDGQNAMTLSLCEVLVTQTVQ